ncbi:MAG: hypothetical protein R2762_13475 [Bryobacteraceae bacterium]
MADRIFLSYWLRGYTEFNMLATFEKALRKFPQSRMKPETILRVVAVDFHEPAQTEHRFEELTDVSAFTRLFREFEHADCAYQVEAHWDLWRYDGDWSLGPVPVVFTAFGPLFASDLGEQILVEFGLDSQFLPQPEIEGSLTPVRSNIRSLLHLDEDLRKVLAVDKRTLWSESGESLAETLQAALVGG